MRVVALLVVLCGCRVGTGTTAVDANTPRGDGLPERVTTDSALWADLRPADATGADRESGGDGVGGDGAASDASDTTDPPCRLLENICGRGNACYPTPIEGPPTGGTTCGPAGTGREFVACVSQEVCDGEYICVTPGQTDAFCRQRCDVNGPNCPPGYACLPVAGYPGVGACTL